MAGPSGAGKTSIADLLIAKGRFSLVRSATTRPPRADGREGEYIYLSEEEFRARLSRGEFVEHTEFSGNMYGTPLSEIVKIASDGKTPILILDMNGISSIQKSPDVDAFSVYIYADISELDRRLFDRGLNANEPAAVTEKRKRKNREDLEALSEKSALFDLVIENKYGEMESVAEQIKSAFFQDFTGA